MRGLGTTTRPTGEASVTSGWIEGDIEVAGSRFHYVRTGDGSQPTMVLAHGFSDDGGCWARLAGDLDGDYDVVMPDARAHGRSARVRPGQKVDQAADLAGVLRALGIEKAVVIGHSMGAWTVSELAARYPDLVGPLILEDVPWRDPEPGSKRPSLLGKDSPRATAMRALHRHTLDEIVDRERVVHPTWRDDVLRTWCAAKLRLDLAFFEIAGMGRMDRHEVIAAIACPTLLITADPELGGIVRPEMATQASAANPLIQVCNIPGVGHHVRFEAYGTYLAAVREFLGSLAQ